MNFANAIYPGGGFINGANAQEESLCRCSTLYSSLNNNKAKEFYKSNIISKSPYDTDHILLSPMVEVFRDVNGNLLDETFVTAVITAPAPNLNGKASNEDIEDIDLVMKRRIRNLFMVAAYNGYSDLILGAWGCGAFGHDAKRVAGYFEEIIVKERYYEFFRSITFAVLDNSKTQYNYNSFDEILGKYSSLGVLNKQNTKYDDVITNDIVESPSDNNGKSYSVLKYPFPAIDIGLFDYNTKNDKGYKEGVFSDGRPFIAELWYDDVYDLDNIVFALPEQEIWATNKQVQL